MNDQARKLLAYVIHRYGVDVIQTPKHLLALLKDHAKGQFKPEISLFMQAVTEGLVIKLLTNQYASVQALSARAIKHLQQDCFIEEQAAHWVIDSWCIALKLARPIPIHTTPAPVAQAKPSPVTAIKSPVPPPTPTVQATPVPATQGTSSRKTLFFLLFLVIVVFLAISNKPDKAAAGGMAQEYSAGKPRTWHWHDAGTFTIASGESTREAMVDAGGNKNTTTGRVQTEETQRLSDAVKPQIGPSPGSDPFGREINFVETPGGNSFNALQNILLGIPVSGYGSTVLHPNVSEDRRLQESKLHRHVPAEGLYTPDGKPTAKLLLGVERVKQLQEAYKNLQENATTDVKLTPEEDFRKAVADLYDADPHNFLDGNAYLKGLHGSSDEGISAVPPATTTLPRNPRGVIEQTIGGFITR